jgi:hypothetical protein
MTNGWLEVAKEFAKVPALLNDIYGDLLKPGVKQVGKALETVIGLGNTILWPFALVNERSRIALEKNLEKYRRQMESVTEDKTVPVPPELGVPIAEKLTYVSDEQLSDMYINLLAKASSSNTAKFAHPSFVNVINSLCPDEALLLKEIRELENVAFLMAQLRKRVTHEWRPINDMLLELKCIQKLSFPNNVSAYISNFEGLGLIRVRRDVSLARPDLYERLEQTYRPSVDAIPFDRATYELVFVRGKLETTTFGQLFMNACLTKLGET